MQNKVNVNREHKNRLFISLFGSAERKEKTLELYNAVNGTQYDNPDDITIYTIEDALYLGMKNDVAFLIACDMNLFEHQSTVNPNMPVRGLMYFAKLYEKYIKLKRLRIHSSTQIKLPTPRYIVFYNGIRERPEQEELRLTTAFDKPEESGIEVIATVLNVNYGKNRKLMSEAQTLEEYAQFIAAVRHYGRELPPEAAIDRAVTECIDKGILAEYLLARKAEVHDMLLTEYNEAEVHQEFWEDGWETGREKGREEGIELKVLDDISKMAAYLRKRIPSLTEEEARAEAESVLRGDAQPAEKITVR